MTILKTLSLKKISVYVHYYDSTKIAEFLSAMPKTLEELVIFRTTELDQLTWSKDFDKLPYKVVIDNSHINPIGYCNHSSIAYH